MPSKPFYSMDEVCQRLGKSQDDIKALVRDGTLREFRDAGKVFFKAEDIEKLGGDAGAEKPEIEAVPPTEDTGEILLEPAEQEGAEGDDSQHDLTPLTDTGSGTSIIGLEPIEEEEAPAEKEKKEDTVITASGIGVFDDDELEIDADPMAKTQITDAATDDQVSLEGSGSGSGLLDLAREADDTALGADLLDEIYPGEEEVTATEEEPAAEAEPVAEAEAEAEEPEAEEELAAADAGTAVVTMPRVVADPWEGMLSGLLVGGVLVMALATTVCAGLLQGFVPDFAGWLADGTNFFIFLGGSVLLAVITLLVGWVLGRALGPKR